MPFTRIAMPVEQEFLSVEYVRFGGGHITGFDVWKNKLAALLPQVFHAIQRGGLKTVNGINYVIQ